MSRTMQVNLQFKADTSKAKSEIEQLQSTLQTLSNTKVDIKGGNIDAAVRSAQQLSQHLQAVTNIDTGRINFSQLSTNLKNANLDLQTLTSNLLTLGPQGQKAFIQVANAVASADLKVRHTNQALKNFGVTLMNTIKWQAASTMIHAAMGAFQGAVRHIEDLDKSLKSIQIVSNKTSAEMAAFAKQAQRLGKELNATTKEYADASLIYFQQGLGEREILERTEATIKMAKVTGTALQTASDQLTAIWNNFSDGSKSLEYYVDVISALGAATASSTDEISQGLEKFAAIAETVGLSYEYAATALATITSETRQSADVVGTALKTLFARMEGLKLGETLDDGTTLNQYSMALAKVGIDIKEANGNLKDMDDILDEMGEKWKTLHKDQQIALAQQVGGIRQYNQLMALMDNWDTFEINLEIAEESKGTLDRQFEVFQTSVEASEKSLQIAKETLYETLFNSDMLKEFNNGLADILNMFTRLIEHAGGLGELLKFGGLLLLQTALPKLEGFLARAALHVKDVIGWTKMSQQREIRQEADQSRAVAGKFAQQTYEKTEDYGAVRNTIVNTGRATSVALNPQSEYATKPQMPGIDSSASASQIQHEAFQEQAGYAARVLDIKADIMKIESGLTDKQREQYKNYQKEIQAQQDLLSLAREKQVESKKALEEGQDSSVRDIRKHAALEQKQLAGAQGAARAAKKAAEEKFNQDLEAPGADKDAIEQAYQRAIKAIDDKLAKDVARLAELRGDAASISYAGKATADSVDDIQNSSDSATENTLSGSMLASMSVDSGGNIAASVENLTRLGELQAQYNADAEIASGLQNEIAVEIGMQENGVKKTASQMKQSKKASESLVKLAQQYEDALDAAFEEVTEGKDELEKIKQKLKDLKSGKIDLGDLSPKELGLVSKAIGKVEKGLGTTSRSAKDLADAMSDDMSEATGQKAEGFMQISENARIAKKSVIDADEASKKLNDTLNDEPPVMPDVTGALTQGMSQALSMATNLQMGIQMLQMGMQTAFDPEASGIETLTGAMMILQGVMSTIQAVQAASNVIDTIAVAIKAAKTAVTKKETAAEGANTVVTGINTAATTVFAVAKAIAAEASKGLAGVITGVLAAALIVGTILTVKATMAQEKETKAAQADAEAKQKQAEGAREAAKAAKEELETVIKLTDAYLDALDVYEKTGEGKENLRKAAFEAINAMGLEGHELEILSGNYATLTQKIKEYNAAKANKAVDTSNKSLSSAGTAFLSKEHISGTGGMWTTKENGQSFLTLSLDEDGKTNTSGDALHRWLAENESPWIASGTQLKAPYSSSNDIPYLMQEFYKLYDGVSAIASASELESMAFFSEAQEMRDSGAWELGQEAASAYATHLETSNTAAKATYLTDKTTSSVDYNKAYEEMVNYILKKNNITDRNSEQAKQLIESLEADLAKDEKWSDFELRRRGINTLQEKYGDSAAAAYMSQKDSSGKTALQKWAEDNGIDEDEAIDLFLKINPQYYDSTQEIDNALARMQEYLDANKIIVKYDLIAGAKSALKETMSSQDWSQFYTEYADLFDPNSDSYIGMSFEEFTNLSNKDRMGILNGQQGNKVAALGNQIAVSEQNLEDFKGNRDTWILNKEQELTDEYNNKIDEYRSDLNSKYTERDRQNFTNNIDEATRWQNGTMSDEEYERIHAWAVENGYGSGELYLKQKWEYLNAFGSELGITNQGFSLNNIDQFKSNPDFNAQAIAAYDSEVAGMETGIAASRDEQHLASLAMADAEIEAYDLEADAVYNMGHALTEMAESSDEVADSLKNDAGAARQIAVEIVRFNEGVEAISSNYSEWMKALKSNNIGEVVTATNELKDVYADMLDMETSDFSEAFLSDADNLSLAYKAAAGDVEAYNLLQINAMKDLSTEFGSLSTTLISGLTNIANIEGIDIGEKITLTTNAALAQSLTQYYNELVQSAINGGATEEVASAYASRMLSAVGFDVALINGVLEFTKKAESFGGNFLDIDDKAIDRKRIDEVITRYYEVDDILDDIEHSLEEANRELDKMYGSNRIKAMKTVNKLLEDQITNLNRRADENAQWAEYDQQMLERSLDNSEFNRIGLEFNIDAESGNITNYSEVMGSLYQGLQNLYDEAEGLTGAAREDFINERVNPYIEWMETVIDYAGTYRDTIEEGEDIANDVAEAWSEWQANNAESLALELELNLKINDAELQKIEYYLGKMADDFYSMAESAALLALGSFDENGNKITSSQLDIFNSNLEAYASAYQNATDAFNSYNPANPTQRWLSEADYYASLEEMSSGIYDNLNSLLELDKAMMNYYGDTLAAAGEELAKFTDRMEHQSSVLDHFSSIMTALGKDTDFKKMGVILDGQAKLIEDQYTVAKQNYEMLSGEVNKKYELWQEALNSGNTAAAELYEKEYEAALSAASEAEEQYLSKAEAWAESLKAVFENTLKDLNKTLEEALTGGTTFDRLNQSMERAKSLQEDYLTKTNKVYETNKLMNTAQQAIDKTTNTVAKRRLQSFIQETKQLQNKSKLSKYELDIQQAKYDLLLAEIALEEAQNAKSTVRLQRDSEGNFGYVYTADANEIADAQQAFLDAQNNLYNLGLEGAENYTEKYQQLMNEFFDGMAELEQQHYEGMFATEEEYRAAQEELIQYHYAKMAEYSEQYQIALSTDSAVAADSWTTDARWMINQSTDWKDAVTKYVSEVNGAFDTWEQKMNTIADETVGDNLKTLSEKVSAVKDASNELRDALAGKDGLLAQQAIEIQNVSDATTKYASLRDVVWENVAAYEALAGKIGKAIQEQNKYSMGPRYSFEVNGVKYGSYTTAEEAAQEAWRWQYVNGSMTKDQANAVSIVGSGGEKMGTVKDYDFERGEKSQNSSIVTGGNDPLGNGTEVPGDNETEVPGGDVTEVPEGNETTGDSEFMRTVSVSALVSSPGSLGMGSKVQRKLTSGDIQSILARGRQGGANGSYYDFDGNTLETYYYDDEALKAAINTFRTYGIYIQGYKERDFVSNGSADGVYNGVDLRGGDTQTKYSDADLQNAIGKAIKGKNTTVQAYSNDGRSWNRSFVFTSQKVLDIKRDFHGKGGAYQARVVDGNLWFLAKDCSAPLDASRFDTGGYTGSWGSYGKLAMLHEKELVLNKQDTANFLLSMEVLERILQAIDLQSISSQIGGILTTPGFSNPNNGVLEQNVHIEANFPNATNRNEIEEAFNNIVNLASQYANRK